jgi:hypothetical protein
VQSWTSHLQLYLAFYFPIFSPSNVITSSFTVPKTILPSSTTKGYLPSPTAYPSACSGLLLRPEAHSVIHKYFLKCPTGRLLATRLTRTIEIGPRAAFLTSPNLQTAGLLPARGTKGLRDSAAPVLWMRGECSIRVKIEPWLYFWTPNGILRRRVRGRGHGGSRHYLAGAIIASIAILAWTLWPAFGA